MLTQAQKKDQVTDLRDRFSRANCVFVADYRGVDVQSVNLLRKRLKTEGGGDWEYRVTKNTVLRRAAEGSDVAAIVDTFEGPTAIALSYGDPAGLAKVLVDFTREHEVFELKGGLLDGKPVDAGEIETLASLPSLDQLRGMIIGLLQAPATKIAQVLAAPGAQLARVLEARSRQESQTPSLERTEEQHG